jgi:hypothetical protein
MNIIFALQISCLVTKFENKSVDDRGLSRKCRLKPLISVSVMRASCFQCKKIL